MRTVGHLVCSSIVAAALSVGCAELITYSNKSNEQGQKLLAEGRNEEAAGAFRDGARQNPRNYESFYGLGQAYERLGREQQALEAYRTAVALMPPPTDPKARAFRAQAVDGLANYIAKCSSREAEMQVSLDKAKQTNDAVDWYVVARTDAATGDADNAIDAYGRAVRAGGDRPEAAITKGYGLYLAQVNQSAEAERVLRKAYQQTPDDPEVNAALRKLGVVPGPSLLAEDQLHKPFVPKGPIPEVELNVKDKNKPAS